MSTMFQNENQMRDLLMRILSNKGFTVARNVKVETFEIDVVASSRLRLTIEGVQQTKDENLYAFEIKIATTKKLARDLIEQAIIRLLVADYVYVVIPEIVKVWTNSKKEEIVSPPDELKKLCRGTYSKKIGIVTLSSGETFKVTKNADKSGLVIKDLKESVLKKLHKPCGLSLFKQQ